MTKSFLSGLIARHLALRDQLPGKEEALICGMCQNLGEILVIFYFSDEYDHINELRRTENLDKFAAARGVLGVGYPELGAAIARSWNLPRPIIESILGLPPGPIQAATNEAELLRDIAVFANELCDLFQNHAPEDIEPAMQVLLSRFSASITLKPEYCAKLINAGYEKLKRFAPIFEINIASSGFCQSVQSWLVLHQDELEEEGSETIPT